MQHELSTKSFLLKIIKNLHRKHQTPSPIRLFIRPSFIPAKIEVEVATAG